MKTKVIKTKDHQKVIENFYSNLYEEEFQGCLFIYDNEFEKNNRKLCDFYNV